MPRLRRWAKRLGLGLLGLFAVLTVASVVYNAATAGAVKPPTALYAGPFVHVDGKLVAYRHWGAYGTPIILLGGFIVPSSAWDGVGKRLGRDYRVYALDLPPFAEPPASEAYTLLPTLLRRADAAIAAAASSRSGHAGSGTGMTAPPPARR